MMKSIMQPIRSFISSDTLIRVKNIQSLTASVHSRLSLKLREHCWVIGITGNKLLIIVNNAESASCLRYQQHELLKQVNEEFAGTLSAPLRRLKVKVDCRHPWQPAASKKRQILRPLSELETAKKHCQSMLKLLEEPLI